MPSVRNLTDIFQLIVDGLNERPLPQEQFVPEADPTIFHVLPDFCEQFKPLAQEEVMQGLRDITSISKELPTESSGELLDRPAIIDIARRHMKSQQFPFIIDDEMQFETVEPSHRGFSPCGHALEDFVRGNAVVVTDSQRRRIDEGNPSTAPFAGGEIATQGDKRSREEFDKTRIAHQMR